MTDFTEWDDVSHWNTSFKPVRAVVAKATQGRSFTDPAYAGMKALTLSGGHHFYAYHFMQHGDVIDQVKHAFSVIGSTPMMLDVEDYAFGNERACPTMAEVIAFRDEYRKLGGILHVIYLPHRVWVNYWHRADLTNLGLRIINADYGDGSSIHSRGLAHDDSYQPFALQFTDLPHDQNISYRKWAEVQSIFEHGK